MTTSNKVIYYIDFFVFIVLVVFLLIIIVSSSRANIQTDSIDYYAILQRLTKSSGNPIVRNLHFVEQRAPGYPIISITPYYFTSLIEPFIKTKLITESPSRENNSPPPETERMLLPSKPLFFKDIFLKNFYIEREDSWFEWKVISSMLFTSYFLLLAGIVFVVGTLALENKEIIGASLVPLVIITSSVFMHNVVNTPAYATLTAFGISSIFGYFFVKGSLTKGSLAQFLSGLFLGFLVLTRLETIVIFVAVFFSLMLIKETVFWRNFAIGSFIAFCILLFYNFSQFGTPFHLGILKGDINQINLDFGYIVANLVNPQSGIMFWSTLASIGILGLFVDNKRHLKILGTSSLILIALILVRVPVMYDCIGEGFKEIGGLVVTCPKDMADALTLIRFDVNRYITVLIPFSILGLRTMIFTILNLSRRFSLFGCCH